MSEQLAHDLVKLVFDHKPELEKVHPSAKEISRDTATDTTPVQLHPGAQRYFDEGQ